MSSFIETTQQATTEHQDMNNKIISQLKTYRFFIFYEISRAEKQNVSILQKINFSLKEDKSQSSDSSNSLTEQKKQVQINFYDINKNNDILHAISDIRNHSFQNKARIILNSSEQKLGYLLEQFDKMKVDLNNIPIMINSNQYQSDISSFLGWKQENKQCMALQSLPFYHSSSLQWILASTQKIDVWQVQIKVSQTKGKILKLSDGKLIALGSHHSDLLKLEQQIPQSQTSKTLKQYFISHFCIGYHASLQLNCRSKIKSNEQSMGNNFIAFMQRLKKFCCIGERNMKKTTGIVNISLVDQKGQQLEILKQLKPGDSSEEQSQNQINRQQQGKEKYKQKQKNVKYKQYNDVVSILLTNITQYQENKLGENVGGKINDNKLELLTFGSLKEHRKICSSTGQVKMKLEAETIDVQIGESFYRLENPEQIKINFAKKIKVGINKRLLKC